MAKEPVHTLQKCWCPFHGPVRFSREEGDSLPVAVEAPIPPVWQRAEAVSACLHSDVAEGMPGRFWAAGRRLDPKTWFTILFS